MKQGILFNVIVNTRVLKKMMAKGRDQTGTKGRCFIAGKWKSKKGQASGTEDKNVCQLSL